MHFRFISVSLSNLKRAELVGGAIVLLLCTIAGLRSETHPRLRRQTRSDENGVKAASWPQADRLFRSDSRWLGGDGAFSVDLGHGRVLWLFGDSFIATKTGETRRQATFIHNSIAIETGYDPAQASIRFYSGNILGKPASFVPSEGADWFWPMQGVRVGNRLLLFFMREEADRSAHSLGFRSVGWNAFLVDNPDATPSEWKLRKLAGPDDRGSMLVGIALLRRGGFLYAFDLSNGNGGNFDTYLLRWPAEAAAAGHLSSPQWWCGGVAGWQTNAAQRRVVIENAGSEFSIERDPRGGFLQVSSEGFGASSITQRRAHRLEGPWSRPQLIFLPPESQEPNAFVYGAKAHPELHGADLIITYTANGSDKRLAADMGIYFPRFVRVTFNP